MQPQLFCSQKNVSTTTIFNLSEDWSLNLASRPLATFTQLRCVSSCDLICARPWDTTFPFSGERLINQWVYLQILHCAPYDPMQGATPISTVRRSESSLSSVESLAQLTFILREWLLVPRATLTYRCFFWTCLGVDIVASLLSQYHFIDIDISSCYVSSTHIHYYSLVCRLPPQRN